jgi:outer membrane lipoprotein-sorting protein
MKTVHSRIVGGDLIMLKRSQSRLLLIACLSSALMGLTAQFALPQAMTADEIIEKNIAARGGLKAWRDIQTITMTGRMDAGSTKNVQLPFVLKLKRPQMSRFELEFAGKTALQVYNGTNGWKVRPYLGRLEVEPFTQQELEIASEQEQFDGFLIDRAAKGIKAEFEGVEPVEGHNAYKLKLTMKNGQVRHLWVDAKTFLEVKVEVVPRTLDGKLHNVNVYYRNYAPVGGLMFPRVLETMVENVKPSRKINIDKIELNAKLEGSVFAKPDISGIHEVKQAEGGSK